MAVDLLIRDGLIVDGTGRPPFRGDVAVDGRAHRRGRRRSTARTPTRTIDAAGRVVCPGFVDPHSHSDFTLLTNPTRRARSGRA